MVSRAMYASEETHRPALAVELVVQFFPNRAALIVSANTANPPIGADIKSFGRGDYIVRPGFGKPGLTATERDGGSQ
jgi:hypothetical protein